MLRIFHWNWTQLRFSSKNVSKKREKIGLPPAFNNMVKQWGNMLDDEFAEKNKQLLELVDAENGLKMMENRGIGIGNVSIVGDKRHPIHDRVITFSRRSGTASKGFRARTPVTLNVIRDNKLHSVIEGSLKSIDKEKIEVRTTENKMISKDADYLITPSQVKSSLQSLKSIISSGEMQKGAGASLINYAFRALPMPSVHDRQLKNIGEDLNEEQRRAVSAAMNEKRPFLCVQGPPGTGKTRVLAEIVRLLLEKKKKVLVCAPSHAAVDNALSACSKVLHESHHNEICNTETIEEAILSHSKYSKLNSLATNMKNLNEEKQKECHQGIKKLQYYIYKDIYKNHRAIFCTLTSSVVRRLPEMAWNADVILVDEAAQCTEPAVWAAISTCKRCILLGDPAQLPAVVLSEKAKKNGLNVSLMERLMKEFQNLNISVLLKQQYRMNKKIMTWSSDFFYDSQLVADECVKDIVLSDKFNIDKNHKLNLPMIMFDTDLILEKSKEKRSQSSIINQDEADLVVSYVYRLIQEHGLSESNISIITPYYAQAEIIRKKLGMNLKVNTVDAFQGQEQEVIIFCLVRDNNYGKIGFLSESRRLNVAITRAKRQFALIGSSKMMQEDPCLKKLYRNFESDGIILSPDYLQGY